MAKEAAAIGYDAEAAQIRWGGSHYIIVVRVGTSGFDTRYLVICIEIITSVSISPLLYRDHSHLLCISQISHPEPSIPKESFLVHMTNFASRSYAYDDEDEDDDEDHFVCFRFFMFFN